MKVAKKYLFHFSKVGYSKIVQKKVAAGLIVLYRILCAAIGDIIQFSVREMPCLKIFVSVFMKY